MAALKKIPKTKIRKWRILSQVTFLVLLSLKPRLDRLFPPAGSLRKVCLPFFQCHGCELAQFACPVGVLAYSSAMHVWPFYALGAILIPAALSGRLICGWACPFGLIQEWIHKIPVPGKFLLPRWTGLGKYLALAGLVVVGPFFVGAGIDQLLYFCNICPAGALEASLPSALATMTWMRTIKIVVLVVALLLMVWTLRPFCTLMCPLGALFSLGNRISFFRLRLKPAECKRCQACKKVCPAEYLVLDDPNPAACIRCLECQSVCPDKKVKLG
jgi:polyferredoxin